MALNGLLDSLAEFVDSHWQPEVQATELKYRDALLAFLRSSLPSDSRIEREYRHDGTTSDIYVRLQVGFFAGEVFVEIKRNLQRKAAYDRLVGQIEGLKPNKHDVLLLLVGETDSALASRLREHYRNHLDNDSGPGLRIVLKTHSA